MKPARVQCRPGPLARAFFARHGCAHAEAKKDLTITGGTVVITGATNYESSSSEQTRKNTNLGTETGWRDLGKGIGEKNTDTSTRQATRLAETTLQGANVNLTATGADGQGATLYVAGTRVDTPGTLSLNADQLILGTQTTQVDVSRTSQGRDLMWQKAKGEGSSDQTTHYVQMNAGQIEADVRSVQAGMGARDSIQSLAQQPGMGWVNQLQNDPMLAGKVDWVKVDEAHTKWQYDKQGLTPEGAAIVTLVAAYFTAGAASGAGASAGAAVGGGTTGTVVAGAVTAGVTALASQAAVAVINNKGDLGATLNDLGSSASVRNLATAIVTGGVLSGLNLSPTGMPTVGSGAQEFMTQLGQNLQAGAAKAVIGTAINGGSLEDSLKSNLKNALLDTAAAQSAFAIGDMALDDFTNKVAHAMAGCAVGAARTDGSCAAGALGAAVGELAAEAYGRKNDTVQLASMIGGIAVAVAGGDASQINLGSQAGGNAAANNYLAHNPANTRQSQLSAFAEQLARCKATAGCNVESVYSYWTDISAQNQASAKNAVAQWAASGDAASLGEFLATAAGALGANPQNFCASGDAKCYQFIQSQNTQAFSAYRDATVFLGSMEYVNGMPRGVSATASSTWKAPTGYEPFNMTGLPAGSRAVVDTATGEIRVVNSIGQIVDVPAGPLPTWTSAADNGTIKIVWGKGIKAQGMPWEDYLATQMPASSRLPAGFKTFDFYDQATGIATSAKTLDTLTSAKLTDPAQIYSSLKGNIDAAASFTGARIGPVQVFASDISSRQLQVAVPAGTTPAQWQQIESAVQYGASQSVKVIITTVK